MTNSQEANVQRQETAKAKMVEAQKRSTDAMEQINRAAWDAAQADMREAETEWQNAARESVETRW